MRLSRDPLYVSDRCSSPTSFCFVSAQTRKRPMVDPWSSKQCVQGEVRKEEDMVTGQMK